MARPRDVSPRLTEQLRQQLVHSYLPDEPLPSLRALAGIYGVGKMTVQRALMDLAGDGIVRARPYHGWIRSGQKPRSAGRRGLRLGIICPLPRSDWHAPMFQILQAEAQRRGVALVDVPGRHARRLTPGSYRIDAGRIPWNAFDVGLLVGVEDSLTLSQELFRRRKIVAVDQDARLFGLNSVSYDNAAIGRLAAEHLLELGHRRFAVLDEINPPGFPASGEWTARRHAFEAAVMAEGGYVRPESRITIARYRTKKKSDSSIAAIVESWTRMHPRSRPSAIFCFDGAPVPKVLEELARCGLRVPRDISIVSLTDAAPETASGGALTVVCVDPVAIARRAFDLAELLAQERRPRREQNREPRIFYVPSLLVAGQSTANAD